MALADGGGLRKRIIVDTGILTFSFVFVKSLSCVHCICNDDANDGTAA